MYCRIGKLWVSFGNLLEFNIFWILAFFFFTFSNFTPVIKESKQLHIQRGKKGGKGKCQQRLEMKHQFRSQGQHKPERLCLVFVFISVLLFVVPLLTITLMSREMEIFAWYEDDRCGGGVEVP